MVKEIMHVSANQDLVNISILKGYSISDTHCCVCNKLTKTAVVLQKGELFGKCMNCENDNKLITAWEPIKLKAF